jgi:EAL domain-containing protein (putative c-di-GMP-specific phosphodiesterase class I)
VSIPGRSAEVPTPVTLGPSSPLPRLGDVLPFVTDRFSGTGALGILAVDGAPLHRIEEVYGAEAHHRCLDRLGRLVRETCEGCLAPHDLVVEGETGRNEVLVFLFREPEGEFYDEELPSLSEAVGHAAAERSGKLFYPYLRGGALAVGSAAVMRNPLVRAETQLLRAIEEARGDADLNRRLRSRQRRRTLTRIVLQKQISSVYEPIVDAKTLTVFGYEALARGPAGTEFAAPLVLFGAAEQEGLVFELDCLCREKGLEGAVDFPAGTKLFLNIRPSAFHDPRFQPDEICRTLEQSRLSPSDVVLEISEQESIANFSVFRQARDEYGQLGFQFAMDDTGAGYASFEAVLELRPEFVKVDRAFVHGIDEDPARQALLIGFQTIAERINARLIGEGLDTLEELRMLGELGVEFGQGWLFGKPHPLRAKG